MCCIPFRNDDYNRKRMVRYTKNFMFFYPNFTFILDRHTFSYNTKLTETESNHTCITDKRAANIWLSLYYSLAIALLVSTHSSSSNNRQGERKGKNIKVWWISGDPSRHGCREKEEVRICRRARNGHCLTALPRLE
jgi:hypothetical protein